ASSPTSARGRAAFINCTLGVWKRCRPTWSRSGAMRRGGSSCWPITRGPGGRANDRRAAALRLRRRVPARGCLRSLDPAHVWEPPRRLGYLWYIRTDRADATEVEIRFNGSGEAPARVEIKHRGWERLGTRGPGWRDTNQGGWEA